VLSEMSDSNNTWNLVAAVGQCAGALATFLAVLVAIYQSKPKIQVTAHRDGLYECEQETLKAIRHVGNIVVTVANIGMFPLEINFVGYKMPHGSYTTTQEELNKLKRKLEPGDSISINFHSDSFKNIDLNWYHIFYAIGSNEKIYLQEANILKRGIRRIWWELGKYTPKYYKYYKARFVEPK
jgi:hypothetical protein